MKDYVHSIYKLEMEIGSYVFDISLPDMFEEVEAAKLPYRHIHAKHEVVFVVRRPECIVLTRERVCEINDVADTNDRRSCSRRFIMRRVLVSAEMSICAAEIRIKLFV